MESLNTFESEMEADGQGSYSLFPALDSISSLSGTPETLERFCIETLLLLLLGFSNIFIYTCDTNESIKQLVWRLIKAMEN